MKLEITTAETMQLAVPELGRPAKKLWYLIIGEEKDKTIINVGEKTFNAINKQVKQTENEKETKNAKK